MKNVFLILLFLTLTISYSQNFSKKWNSTYQRYDYSDSNGYLMGYEKWNSTYQRWDYNAVNTNTNRPTPVMQPIEQGGNLELAMRVVNEKQRRYDINKAKLDEHIRYYEKGIMLVGKFEAKVSSEEIIRVNNIYFSFIKNLLNNNYDLSAESTLKYLMGTIEDYAVKLPCKEWRACDIK